MPNPLFFTKDSESLTAESLRTSSPFFKTFLLKLFTSGPRANLDNLHPVGDVLKFDILL